MIHSLCVENIALIDKLNIEFDEGLNVLTGETGAGKSIIVNSMNLVLGERADREMIRHGCDSARVEAILYIHADDIRAVLEQYGIACDDEMVVSRELSVSGKNTCRMNGAIVNLSTLKHIMDHVVDLHGQHEHQSLLNPATHLQVIDNLGGDAITKLKKETHALHKELRELESKLGALGGDASERRDTMNLLEFQIRELEEADVRPGEVGELKQERDVLANAQAITAALNQCYELLYAGEGSTSVASALRMCTDALAQIASFSETIDETLEKLNEHRYALEEIAHDMNAQAESVVFDERRQEEVEERIAFINALERKYHVADERELIAFGEAAQVKLEMLVNSEQTGKVLTQKISEVKDTLFSLYGALSEKRKQAAGKLEKLALREMAELGMKHAQFEVRFTPFPAKDDVQYTEDGVDEAEFFISTNMGEPPKPLSKTASGGEISRIMLALKNISADMDSVSTLIFDEIDTGISGNMALVVAGKLASIAKRRQVVCVTHLAQIAAMADKNFYITKESRKGSTVTEITRIQAGALTDEIARLSGGIKTDNAYAHANELLENARKMKREL